MRALAVIGSNFGDEGKGLMVDYLCATEGAGVVVRFNGGAQAGHTVVTPDGHRHVFSHFGSGSFLGVPTFLSQHFVCNPLLFVKEHKTLPMQTHVYAHPSCLVTTPADMLVNQALEAARGSTAHGSCGVGFQATIERSLRNRRLTMRNLWEETPSQIEERLHKITTVDLAERFGIAVKLTPELIEEFVAACRTIAALVSPATIVYFEDPVFEGAQGLLLDQNNREYFPHLTRSNTGIRNVRELCDEARVGRLDAYYVSRTYLTRHGAGPLPGEDQSMSFPDDTNVSHPWQGSLRFAPLDPVALYKRCVDDFGTEPRIVFTHCDQLTPALAGTLHAFGPHREAVEAVSAGKRARA